MGRSVWRARRGEGKVYKRGRLWAIRWTENGERHYSGGYLNEADATRVLAILSLNMRAGRPGLEMLRPPKAEPLPTFGGRWRMIGGDGTATSRPCSGIAGWTRRSTPVFWIG